MNDIDPELDGRLALLREAAEPTHADKHRLLVALRTSVRADAGAPPASMPPEPATSVVRNRWGAAVRPFAPWLGGAIVGACITLALGFGWDRAPGVRAPAPIAPGRAAATAEDTHVSGVLHVDDRLDVVAPREVAPAARDTAAPLGLGLAEALERLHRAERALYAGDGELALGILSELDRGADPALLREERLTTRVLALCQGGRVEEARNARRALQRELASSIYVKRLDESCAVERDRQ